MSGNGCGPRQTGTVPKTKHNTRHSRREHNQNLDWNHQPYSSFQMPLQRGRKESNTSGLSDAGDDYDENPWIGLPIQHGEDGARSWMGKSSNLSPERSCSMSSIEAPLLLTPQARHHHHDAAVSTGSHHPASEEPMSATKEAEKIRLKRKIEQSRRRIGELQQQHAAYLTMRNKAIQQVKPVQVEEMHQNHSVPVRNKVIQQVKPVQQPDLDQINNIERRIQNIEEFASLIQNIESDIDNVAEGSGETAQQLRRKLQELIDKKAHMDHLLAYFESTKVSMEGAQSVSSDEGDRRDQRECCKRDNSSILDNFSLNADQWGNNMENPPQQLHHACASHRANGDGASSQLMDSSKMSLPKPGKAVHKKVGLDELKRRCKAASRSPQANGLTLSNLECWSLPTRSPVNSGHISSDEGEYEDSPVKLDSPNAYIPNSNQPPFNKTNFSSGMENAYSNGPCFAEKCTSTSHVGPENKRADRSECCNGTAAGDVTITRRGGVQAPQTPDISYQLSQLQLQLEQMQAAYQVQTAEKHRHQYHQAGPWEHHAPHINHYPNYGPYSQWHQNQLLISSLNQCCQLIWHQLREITALRQALNALRADDPTYGPNLSSLGGWQPPLNNQVPPGNRANNYWDNFRSYSRQNLLSGRAKSNELRRAPDHPDNLRRVDNNNPTLNNRMGPLRNGGNVVQPSNRGGHMNNTKRFLSTCRDPISLEQSVYSELENVIQEPARSPHRLLQLLGQLRSIRSHQENAGFDGAGQLPDQRRNGLLDSRLPGDSSHGSSHSESACHGSLLGTAAAVSRIAAAAQAGQAAVAAGLAVPGTSLGLVPSRLESHSLDPGSSHQPDGPFDPPSFNSSTIVEEASRILEEALSSGCEVVTEDLLSRLLDILPAPKDQNTIVFIMSKFLNTRLADVAEELLCSVTIFEDSNNVEETSEEEGAVGGCVAIPSPHSVETELAEADQRSSCDNLQVNFQVLNETDNIVLDNETQDNTNAREDGASLFEP